MKSMKHENKKGHMHLHTPASDGLITPQEIMDAGLDFVCITDHDSTRNTSIYARELQKAGIRVIYGVEATAQYKGYELHALVYFPTKQIDETIRAEMLKAEERRKHIASSVVRFLKSKGFKINEGLLDMKEKVLTRGNICEEIYSYEENKPLLGQIGMKSKRDFYKRYLDKGGPGYISIKRSSLEEYIGRSEGVKVLAHPGQDFKIETDDGVIEEIVRKFGFKGIEVNTRRHNNEEITHYQNLASKLGVLGITSNDCHLKEDLYKNVESEETLDALLFGTAVLQNI